MTALLKRLRRPHLVAHDGATVERDLKRAPARWEHWRDTAKRLRVISRTFHPLLTLARDHLAELLAALMRATDAGAVLSDDHAALAAKVLRVRGAALNVGAVRAVQLVDVLWAGEATAEAVADLHAALTIELAAFDQALQSRSAPLLATAAAR